MKKTILIALLFISALSFGQEPVLREGQRKATFEEEKEIAILIKDFENGIETNLERTVKCKIISRSYDYSAGNGGPNACTTLTLRCDGYLGNVYAVQLQPGGSWLWSFPQSSGGIMIPATPVPCD